MREERKQGLAFRSHTKPSGSSEAAEEAAEEAVAEEEEETEEVVERVVGTEARSASGELEVGCDMAETRGGEVEGGRRECGQRGVSAIQTMPATTTGS